MAMEKDLFLKKRKDSPKEILDSMDAKQRRS